MMGNKAAETRYKTSNFLIESEARIAVLELAAAKASKGDSEALALLCEYVAKDVLFRMSRMLRNHVDAEDAAQEVLIRVCKNIRQLKNPKTFRKWLGTIIVNEARRKGMQNAKMSEKVIHLSNLPDAVSNEDEGMLPEQFAVNTENRKTVMGAIDKLPQRQREAIILHYYDRLNVTETAEVMGISQPAVSIHIREACSRIKRDLEATSKELIRTMQGFMMIPFGDILSRSLYTEGALFTPQNQSWVPEAVAKCGELALVGASMTGGIVGVKRINVNSKFGLPRIAKTLFSIVIAASVTLGLTFVAVSRNSTQNYIGPILNATGSVVFISNHEPSFINPIEASAISDSKYGKLKIHHWEIRNTDEKTVLFFKASKIVTEDIFQKMREEGFTGNFELVFILEDAIGIKYELAHNFYLLNESAEK